MKRNLLVLLFTAALTFSCSSDSEDDNNTENNSIIGSWELSGLEIDSNTAGDELTFAKGIFDALVAGGCDIITFTFNEDGTVITEVRDFSEAGQDLDPSGGGLIITCPENQETATTNWTLEGDQLTFTDEDGIEETITVDIDGNTLTVDAEFVDENNLADAEAVFTRK